MGTKTTEQAPIPPHVSELSRKLLVRAEGPSGPAKWRRSLASSHQHALTSYTAWPGGKMLEGEEVVCAQKKATPRTPSQNTPNKTSNTHLSCV